MVITSVKTSDIDDISLLWEDYYSHDFGLPTLDRTVTSAVVRANNDSIIGFGMVKLWPEAIMILDQSKSKFEQSKAMKMLMKQAIQATKHFQFEQLYATTTGDNVADLCRNHYYFKDLNRIVLVKSL